MKAIIVKTIEEFDKLNERIHLALQQNIPNYSGIKWADPIINSTTAEIACLVETDGLRGAVILGLVLNDLEKASIVELNNETDLDWFPKTFIDFFSEVWHDETCKIQIKLPLTNNAELVKQYPELSIYIKENNINTVIDDDFVFIYLNFILPEHRILLETFGAIIKEK